LAYPLSITNNIFLLELTIPLSALSVNCYIIKKGVYFSLIDAGLMNDDCWYQLLTGLKNLGLNLYNLHSVMITHAHIDHYGLVHRLRDCTGAKIYLHPSEKILVANQVINQASFANGLAWFGRHGLAPDEIKLMTANMMNYYDYLKFIVPDHWYINEEIISLPGVDLKVCPTPGHTPGHVCLYDQKNGILFTGDHILKNVTTHVGRYWWYSGSPLDEYLESLAMMMNIKPQIVLPGHGSACIDLSLRCGEIRRYRIKRNQKIMRLLKYGKKNAWSIVTELWGDLLNPAHKRLALADILAHLFHLMNRGLVKKGCQNNTVSWELSKNKQVR